MNNDSESKYTASGPIFEPGPGWGIKLKKWVKKYALGGDCTLCRATRYVLVFGVVVLLLLIPPTNERRKTSPITANKVSETVQPRDGQTHLVRRILARYLAQNTELKLINGQKIFIETILRETIPNQLVRVGNEIEIEVGEIKKAVERSKSLTASQLQKWEKYAEGIKFE